MYIHIYIYIYIYIYTYEYTYITYIFTYHTHRLGPEQAKVLPINAPHSHIHILG